MNPFDWRGPEFLLFYLCFGGVVLLLQYLFQKSGESGAEPPQGLVDPYSIAYLRGGAEAAGQVAILSLIDRRLLETKDNKVSLSPNVTADQVTHPVEKSILVWMDPLTTPRQLTRSSSVKAACSRHAQLLEQAGLLPDEAARSRRRMLCAMAIILLGGVSLVKVLLALERGHHNIGFLILLTLVFGAISVLISARRRTALGDQAIDSVQGLCQGLNQRASGIAPGAQTSELMLLAAAFGTDAVPGQAFPHARRLFAQPGDSGSSCSSGGSCGGGSSCGGGGCGGGGCGGCGS